MQHIRRPPVRNKINMADPIQVRAWSRRLRISADTLQTLVEKVGDSVAAVTKEVELQRLARRPRPVSPKHSIPREPAVAEATAPV